MCGCHSERCRRISRQNLNCNETLRIAQGDSLNVILSVAEESQLRITHYALKITHYCSEDKSSAMLSPTISAE